MRCEVCDSSVGIPHPYKGKIEILCKECRSWMGVQRSDYYHKDHPEAADGFLPNDAFVTTLEDFQDLDFSYGDESYE